MKFFVVFACFFVTAPAEFYTSLKSLENVLHAEQALSVDIRKLIALEENRLMELKHLASRFANHSSAALENVETFLSNPLNAFLLVKQFIYEWEKVERLLRNEHGRQLSDEISSLRAHFPDLHDLHGAASGLLRLQDTYALQTQHIARGELLNVRDSPAMNAEQCFTLGKLAYDQHDYYHTVLWMEEALIKLRVEKQPSVRRAEILDYLSFSAYRQGDLQQAMTLTSQWMEEEPEETRAKANMAGYERMYKDASEANKFVPNEDEPPPRYNRQLQGYRATKEFEVYEKLCRGEPSFMNSQPRYKGSSLTCQYRRHRPRFYLSPLLEEVHSWDPFIAVYHKVLTDRSIHAIQQISVPKLHRSGVFKSAAVPLSYNTNPEYRTSKTAWLLDVEDELIERHSLLAQAITNMTLESAEDLQVLNYGIGGHYEPHTDYAKPEEQATFDVWRGNRILTMMCYMNDVTAGGATVYPRLGVRLAPIKGSCAVWYNLLSSTEGDPRTRHAGCPVLAGYKWVCNKWFHTTGQEFTRPCAKIREVAEREDSG